MKIFKIAKQVTLYPKWKDILSNLPESGMGYQGVDVYLKDGRIFKNLVVYNGETIEAQFDKEDIADIKLSK